MFFTEYYSVRVLSFIISSAEPNNETVCKCLCVFASRSHLWASKRAVWHHRKLLVYLLVSVTRSYTAHTRDCLLLHYITLTELTWTLHRILKGVFLFSVFDMTPCQVQSCVADIFIHIHALYWRQEYWISEQLWFSCGHKDGCNLRHLWVITGSIIWTYYSKCIINFYSSILKSIN